MKLCGTELMFSTAFHPQTDGMAEVTNRTLEQLVRLYCDENKTNWYEKLNLIQLYYNSTPQSRTGYSPHYVITGRDLKLLVDLALTEVHSDVPASAPFAEDLITLW